MKEEISNKNMKAVIFARVSSKDQEDGHSLDAQIQSGYKYAIEKDFNVLEQFKIVESSTANGRPEFARMVQFVKKQSGKTAIICYCVDRLQRDFDEQSLELRGFVNQDRAEIHFISTKQKITKEADSSTKFRYGLDVLLANDYANRISDNVKRSNQKKLEEGTICGDSPVGYINKKRLDKKKEKVEVYIDPERGHLIQKMFQEYSTGLYSIEEIRKMITNEGLRSKKNCKISKSQAENVLKNPFYYGYMEYNGILYKHIHPRLIDKELFDLCQEIRNGKRKTGYKRTEKPFILKGLLKCQHCKCSYSPELKKEKYVYMRPTKCHGECSYCFHLKEEAILSQIENVLKGISIPQDILEAINEELKSSVQVEHKHQIAEINKITNQLESTQNRMKRARDLYLDNELEKQEYQEMTTELEVERQNLTTRLNHLQKDDKEFSKNISTIFEIASKSYEIFKSSELDEKRRIINILFPNLEMNQEKLVFTIRKPLDAMLNLGESPLWLRE